MDPPEEVMRILQVSRLLETVYLCSHRVAVFQESLRHPVLARGIGSLQNYNDAVFALGIHLVLKLAYLLQHLFSLLFNLLLVPFLVKCGVL